MHRRTWITAAAIACAASITMAARNDDKSITVTGCVQNFSSTGISGVTERGFLLADPTPIQAPSDGVPIATPTRDTSVTGVPTGTSGTAAAGMPTSGTWPSTATPGTRKAKSYRLDGDDQELKAQVGHKVEVTGAMEPKKDGEPNLDGDRMQVSAIKMLDSSCSK